MSVNDKSPEAPQSPPRTRQRSTWPLIILAALFIIVPFLTWYTTWFGRDLSDAEIDRVLAEPLERLWRATIVEPDALRADLADIRAKGWAKSFEETNAGAWGLAVPILDGAGHVVAGVGLAGPNTRLGQDEIAAHVRSLADAVPSRAVNGLTGRPGGVARNASAIRCEIANGRHDCQFAGRRVESESRRAARENSGPFRRRSGISFAPGRNDWQDRRKRRRADCGRAHYLIANVRSRDYQRCVARAPVRGDEG